MLKEFVKVKQEGGGARRRWFEDDGLELIVWYDAAGAVEGFQILYGRGDGEHALSWRAAGGFAHHRVDQGDNLFSKLAPILVPDGAVPWARIATEFAARGARLEPALRELVQGKLQENETHGP
ncbi:MAG: hypothetical protein HY302_04025 [Opitutae bacterium]|nr:hypothetical protein [Opitutae bacterium]